MPTELITDEIRDRVRDRLEPTVREIAAANEGRSYIPSRWNVWPSVIGSCLYVHPTDFGCLIGKALARLGVPRAFLIEHEGEGIAQLLESIFPLAPLSGEVDQLSDWCESVQDHQDVPRPWDECIRLADEAREDAATSSTDF